MGLGVVNHWPALVVAGGFVVGGNSGLGMVASSSDIVIQIHA